MPLGKVERREPKIESCENASPDLECAPEPMKKLLIRAWSQGGGMALAVLMGMVAAPLTAQQSIFGRVKDFSVPEYYDPPRQNQVKSLLTGAEAQPQADGTFLIKEVKLETYRETGERTVIVVAPECVYDSARRTASSASRIQVQTGDGQFSIEGEGFLWRQSVSSLIISNRVHTTVRLERRKSEPSKS